MSPKTGAGSVQVVEAGRPSTMEAAKRSAQDRVLALLAAGHKVETAMGAVNRSTHTYFRWRQTEKWFADRADAVRSLSHDDDASDFVTFRRTYFGFETFAHQQLIVDAIEESEEGSITMILLPPGAGKTTVLEDWICMALAEDPNHRICYITKARTLARKVLRRVANRMTNRADPQARAFIDRYGPFKPDDRAINQPWNADVITHCRANSGERDYSMEALGAGSAIYGSEYDTMVLDDIQDRRSLATTESLLDYFKQEVYSRVMRANSKGRIVIPGSRVGAGDFYEGLLRTDFPIKLVKVPALDEHGHSYFPQRTLPNGVKVGFSEAELDMTRRLVEEDVWSRVYMQEPVSKRGRTFSDAVIERGLDRTRTISELHPPGMFTIGTLDPALAGNAAFRIVSYDYERMYVMLSRNEGGLARYEEMWQIIDELSGIYFPNVWVIEGNAIQGGIARSDAIEELASRYGFRIETHQTGRNKMDDTIGIASMAGSFLRGEVSIPYGDEESKDNAAKLIDELTRWRPDVPTKLLTQDEVMSLWFAWLHWRNHRQALASRIDRHIQAPRLPYRPTQYAYVGAGR